MVEVDPYLHAALVLYGAGKKEISGEDIVSVLKAAGAEPDEARAKVLSDVLKGKDLGELLEKATVAVAAAPAPQPSGDAPKEEKKEEKKEEDDSKKEEQAAEGLASLFG